MSAPTPLRPLGTEKIARITLLLRLMGAAFVLGGGAVGADLGGIATASGLNDGSDGSLHPLFGGLLVLVGLVDIFVLPVFFKKIAGNRVE